jgi:hypothetical protein
MRLKPQASGMIFAALHTECDSNNPALYLPREMQPFRYNEMELELGVSESSIKREDAQCQNDQPIRLQVTSRQLPVAPGDRYGPCTRLKIKWQERGWSSWGLSVTTSKRPLSTLVCSAFSTSLSSLQCILASPNILTSIQTSFIPKKPSRFTAAISTAD